MPKEPVFCACGCGKITPIAPCTRPSRGWVKGEHVEYFPHHSKNRWPVSDGTTKKCRGCLEELPVARFAKAKRSADGLQAKCRDCQRQMSYSYRKSDGGIVRYVIARRKYHLKTYRISEEEYSAMLFAQDGLCAICQGPEIVTTNGRVRRLAIDHCHSTGKVRGLLCAGCNHAIGKFKDDPDLLMRAAEYLRLNRESNDNVREGYVLRRRGGNQEARKLGN